MNGENNTLAHTVWTCKYHIVFAPKYRRKVFYGEIRSDVRDILKQLCFKKEWKYWRENYARIMCICWSQYLRNCLSRISWDISKERVLWWYTRNTEIWSINTEADSFGVEDIMWTQQERTQRKFKSTYKTNSRKMKRWNSWRWKAWTRLRVRRGNRSQVAGCWCAWTRRCYF